MDDDDAELIVRLCTRAGMIMEDASVLALDRSGLSADRRRATLVDLAAASRSISALVLAAESLSSK